MEPIVESTDLFCRINAQAEMPFVEFVAAVAHCAGGTSRANTVRNRCLDISVHENDEYDPEKARSGNDRWLYFRYMLEVDPLEGFATADYTSAIGALLQSLWASCIEAVAASDFEDRLPRNDRRVNWQTGSESQATS